MSWMGFGGSSFAPLGSVWDAAVVFGRVTNASTRKGGESSGPALREARWEGCLRLKACALSRFLPSGWTAVQTAEDHGHLEPCHPVQHIGASPDATAIRDLAIRSNAVDRMGYFAGWLYQLIPSKRQPLRIMASLSFTSWV